MMKAGREARVMACWPGYMSFPPRVANVELRSVGPSCDAFRDCGRTVAMSRAAKRCRARPLAPFAASLYRGPHHNFEHGIHGASMSHELQFYIDGAWVDPTTPKFLDVIDPTNEDAFARAAVGSKRAVEKGGA